ncbi:MAG: M42 family metallopeptidase [Ruminococcaceae bacterium]|nr:M42 family metallopeptidase [Oscillospiraceae bacterium]
MSEKLELLRSLCLAFGPSGCEDEVREKILAEGKKYCADHRVDGMGNLVFSFRPEGATKKMMLSAHMDEVGFMIHTVTDEGYLKFATLGGIDERVLCGRCVTVGNETRRVSGVIASKAIHHQDADERKKTTPAKEMLIDIGASSKEEAEKLVSIGDFGTFDSEFYEFGDEKAPLIKSKALDDRLGCAVMLLTMRKIASGEITPSMEVDFCFTVREELGLSGAKVVAERLAPDYAIVLETTAIADVAGTEASLRVADVGQGGAISLLDRSTIYDTAFVRYALELAEANGVPAQVKRFVSGGNDAGHIHKSGKGVKCLALSAPTRYLHSPSCVAALADYEAVERLVALMLNDADLERKV